MILLFVDLTLILFARVLCLPDHKCNYTKNSLKSKDVLNDFASLKRVSAVEVRKIGRRSERGDGVRH